MDMSNTPTLLGGETIVAETTPAPRAPSSRPSPSRVSSSGVTSSSSSGWSGAGRFAAGTILASRYRIVAALGRGGMGEVFRAEDLTLQQEIALKFLPKELTSDPEALERFHREVRVARQVSHPNVCRVFDIGVSDGAPFITMEYVDGEDLSSLLRRIGRFPQDKGLEISRQVCAGLAAAHEQGLLHRDLKPANIMLDGRGRVRITDFGLASLAGEVHGGDVRAGTPAYMAPEQLAGKEVTLKSDIYALGLVLYEIFTGKRAFDAPTLQELTKQRETSSPTNPTMLVKDLDPLVERVIERCLERDPAKRPASALQVAAALPGGDPLAAALAAGETPSPEMVAASGSKEGIRPLFVWACIGIVVLSLIFEFAVSGRTRLYRAVAMPMTPEVLEQRAKDMLKDFGYVRPPADSATGYDIDGTYLNYIDKNDMSPDRWSRANSTVQFWYRRTQTFFATRQILGSGVQGQVTSTDPPPEDAGMIIVNLDPLGNLEELRVETARGVPEEKTPPLEPDWKKLLTAAGFDPANCTVAEPRRNPPVYADVRAAWTVPMVERPKVTMRLEAAAYRGRPVSFIEVGPWSPAPGNSQDTSKSRQISIIFASCIVGSLLVAGIVLAWKNLKQKRADLGGALRLAGVVLATEVAEWVIGANHQSGFWEAYSFTLELAWACLASVFLWMLYVALEPVVRRKIPTLLISWNRLLAGNFRDPMIGRDLLAGAALGVFSQVLGNLDIFYNKWRGLPPPVPESTAFKLFTGGRIVFAQLFSTIPTAIFNGLALMLMVVILQIILRNRWVAAAGFMLIFVGQSALQGGSAFNVYFIQVIDVALLTFLVLRFGLLALTVYVFMQQIMAVPITTDTSAWYAWMGWFGMAVIAAIVVYGARIGLAGQPFFGRGLVADD
jgi:protein kinase-like protein